MGQGRRGRPEGLQASQCCPVLIPVPAAGCSSLATGDGRAASEPGGSMQGTRGSQAAPGSPAAGPQAGDAGLEAAPAAGGQGGLGTEPRLLARLCSQGPGWCQGPCVSLQALQDQRRQGEERAEALKQRYQALLQEVLRDAVELSTHNQELQEARRHSSADATTQTP